MATLLDDAKKAVAAKEEELAEMAAELESTRRQLSKLESSASNQHEEAAAFIAAVSKVDLPSFWAADPVLWFRQCESAFRRHGAVSSGVKFDHVVGKLPNDVTLSCRSLLLDINFEDTNGYERLKAHLCRNYGKSKWQRGYALLECPGLGDRRPTQMLQDLRAVLPPGETEGVLFQCIFLKQLPTPMADAIHTANLDDVELMAEMADRLFDRPTPFSSVAAVCLPTPCCQHISAIDNQQRRFNRSGRSPDRTARSPERRAATPGGGGGRNRNSTSSKGAFAEFLQAGKPAHQWVSGAKKNWCDKHKFFGAKALQCRTGCTFSEN